MPRDATQDQIDRLNNPSTMPIYLVEINHSGTVEYLSCSSEIEFDGQVFSGGGINVRSIVNAESAQLTLNPTPERVGEVLNSTYRRGVCKIWMIPGLPTDSGVYVAADAFLMLDGAIDTSSYAQDNIVVFAADKYLTGRTGPGILWDQLCNHMPAPGSSITWEGETQNFEPVEESTSTRTPFYLW